MKRGGITIAVLLVTMLGVCVTWGESRYLDGKRAEYDRWQTQAGHGKPFKLSEDIWIVPVLPKIDKKFVTVAGDVCQKCHVPEPPMKIEGN